MKFIYGKQDFKTLNRGQENCYLLTNGLGGFSSGTMVGSNTRNDHALLMACVKAPNHRVNMVHRISESIQVGTKEYALSSQELTGRKEEGYVNQIRFAFEDCPQWHYQVEGVEIVKIIGMKQFSNTVGVSYEIRNCGRTKCKMVLTPFFQFVNKGDDLKENQQFLLEQGKVTSEGKTLYFETNGQVEEISSLLETNYYSYDACDGRRETGKALANHKVTLDILPGEDKQLNLVYSMEPVKDNAESIIQETIQVRKALDKQAGFTDPLARTLVKSAAQFIAKRESTKGETILAGFPFFEDWGRDTMIALPGCALSTGQLDTAKSILRTFMASEQRGLMPNLFPEGKNEPAYNTVDAALLFINCMYLYYQKTGDFSFVEEAYPVMVKIMEGYEQGTDFGIHMDTDGLILAGKGLDQVTWMDVRVGEILPTPRHGKPVEISAYWYNALCIMEQFTTQLGKESTYAKMAAKTKKSFCEKFWMEEQHCLKDVLSESKADTQIRCNQIWAVSLPFTMLEQAQEKMVVNTVFEKLYTPYGLRTLNIEDEEFCPTYGGAQLKRDLAYHQGTVWTFPLGAWYLAYLKVSEYSKEAIRVVRRQLEVMESALREGCIGQLPEIYDGENPTASRGCFAQAWSVGEILRVYEVIEEKE